MAIEFATRWGIASRWRRRRSSLGRLRHRSTAFIQVVSGILILLFPQQYIRNRSARDTLIRRATPEGLRASPPLRDSYTTTWDASSRCRDRCAPVDEMVAQIAQPAEPSGTNTDYLCRLETALRRLEIEDADVFELARRIREGLAGG